MVQINFALREVNCKIVYYGPGMSGKTTNLEVVHEKAPISNKGELTSIATEGDRTLFFDFMPLDLGNIAGMRTKFQLYTVPGQVYYNSTRKLVLQGVDGIIFVADSQESKADENVESLENLRNNLAEYGKNIDEIPLVIQYNKRDLPTSMSVETLNERLNPRGLPWFEAVAVTGQGVFPTLKALSAMVLESLSKERRSASSRPSKKPAAANPAPTPAPEPVAVAAEQRRSTAKTPAQAAPRSISPVGAPIRTAEDMERERERAAASSAPPPTARPPTARPPEQRQTPPPRPSSDRGSRTPPTPITPASRTPTGRGSPSRPGLERGPGAGRGQPPRREISPSAGPQIVRGAVDNTKLNRLMLDEEKGSPLFLIVLGGVIATAIAVILYSFKII